MIGYPAWHVTQILNTGPFMLTLKSTSETIVISLISTNNMKVDNVILDSYNIVIFICVVFLSVFVIREVNPLDPNHNWGRF